MNMLINIEILLSSSVVEEPCMELNEQLEKSTTRKKS